VSGDAIVGIIANPSSGRDVRRLLANAATSTIDDKVTIVRRVAIGAVQAGATKLLVMPDPFGLCRRALSTVSLDAEVQTIEVPGTHDERVSVRTAEAMRDAGVGAIVVLGGDGTNRAVSKGWADAPVVALSTGTNNVFPTSVEPTIAGAAAGLVASGRVPIEEVAMQAKRVHVDIEGEEPDFALIDAVLTRDRFARSLMLFDPSTLSAAVLAVSEPGAVGISSIGGLLHPCSKADDGAVDVRMAPPEDAPRQVLAPTAPGIYTPIGITSCEPMKLGDVVTAVGPGVLAFDGERSRSVTAGARLTFRVERDGPMVIDARRALHAAAERGLYVSG
jgi:hypothetical protein